MTKFFTNVKYFSRVSTLGVFCLLLLPNTMYGYFVSTHDLTKPYEVLPLSELPTESQFIIGELDGYPEMIEFTSENPITLSFEIYALPTITKPDLNGIAIEVLEPRGVKEVARLKSVDASWDEVTDEVSKIKLLQGPSYIGEVASGTYRIEVSTPENYGKYLIRIGTSDVSHSYGETWRSVSTLYEFAGVTKFGMIRTPLVYYPFGIILVIVGISYTLYRTRNRLPFFNHA